MISSDNKSVGLYPRGELMLERNIASLREEIERFRRVASSFDAETLVPALLGSIHEGGVCIYDPRGKILSAWLPLEVQERLGLNIQGLIGNMLQDFLPPGVIEERLRLMQVAHATGETQYHDYQSPLPGGEFWFHSTISPLYGKDGESEPFFVVFFRDVTAAKLADIRRQESETRYRWIVESSRDAIMLNRPDGIIEYMSPSAQQVVGWPPEDLIGTLPIIVAPEDMARAEAFFRQALAGERGCEEEYRILTKDGERRWISHSWTPILNEGRTWMIVSTIRDITAQKRMEQQLLQNERLAAIGQTVADVAHQLKSICLNIRGSASLIDRALEEQRTDTVKLLWNIFVRSADRLGSLANGMLEYAALDKINTRSLYLNELVHDICEESRGKAERRRVTLLEQLDPRLGPVKGDESRLSEVLINLIANAIDAVEMQPAGAIEVRTVWSAEPREARVEITDNGPGIPPDILPRIFDPFFSTKGAKGSGLGLAIAHKVTQLHGGAIEVASCYGRTTMAVVLPVEGE